MIKIGLIGAGFMGGTHAACYEALAGIDGFIVTAVADLDEQKASKLADKFGAKIYATGDELIETADVNVVDICLPTYLHTSHALKAMQKGFDVFVEKPVCLTEGEAKDLLDMKNKTGVKVAVGQCIRFWDEYVYLKSLVENRTYGRLLSGVFKRISPRPNWGWDNWLLDGKRSGSAALDLHIHDVDFVRYLMGIPQKIKSSISSVNGQDEHIFSIFEYKDAVINLEGGWDYPSEFPFEMAYRVNFEKASVVFSTSQTPSLMVYNNDGTSIQPQLKKDFTNEGSDLGGNLSSLGGYYNELKYFIECLKDGKPLEVAPLEEGIESFRLTIKEIEVAKEQLKY